MNFKFTKLKTIFSLIIGIIVGIIGFISNNCVGQGCSSFNIKIIGFLIGFIIFFLLTYLIRSLFDKK